MTVRHLRSGPVESQDGTERTVRNTVMTKEKTAQVSGPQLVLDTRNDVRYPRTTPCTALDHAVCRKPDIVPLTSRQNHKARVVTAADIVTKCQRMSISRGNGVIVYHSYW
jgi:hypothetical protein